MGREAAAMNLLKIFDATLNNLVFWVGRLPELVHP